MYTNPLLPPTFPHTAIICSVVGIPLRRRGFPLVTVLHVMFMGGGEDVIDTKMSSVSLFSYQLMVGLPLVYLIVIMFY